MTVTAPSQPSKPQVTVHWDDKHDEPYLSPPSHPHVRVTPYRDTEADIASIVSPPPSLSSETRQGQELTAATHRQRPPRRMLVLRPPVPYHGGRSARAAW